MGVSGAMSSAVAGLVANSTAVARISENIANSGTVGYKRTFAEMVTQSIPGEGSVSSVKAFNGSNVSQEGILNSTSSSLDLAVSGSGFFVVSKSPNDPLLSNYFLTRAGSFKLDEQGFMVNSAGYYLAAYELDPLTGSVGAVDRNTFGGLTSVRVGDLIQPAEPTNNALVSGNLPAQETGITPPGAPFLASMEFYSQLGRSEKLTLSWQPTSVINTWELGITDSTGAVYQTLSVAFDNAGPTPGAPASYTLAANQPANAKAVAIDSTTGTISISVDVNNDPLPIDINLGAPGSYDGVQQFVGDFTPQKFTVNGAPQAALARSETDQQGIVWGVFDNGSRRPLYEIPLAQVANADGMTLVNGSAYQVSRDSGSVLLTQAGSGKNGNIVSGALEASTVEVATELTDLIRVQRAFSSNAKIITTADEMLQEITQLKR